MIGQFFEKWGQIQILEQIVQSKQDERKFAIFFVAYFLLVNCCLLLNGQLTWDNCISVSDITHFIAMTLERQECNIDIPLDFFYYEACKFKQCYCFVVVPGWNKLNVTKQIILCYLCLL